MLFQLVGWVKYGIYIQRDNQHMLTNIDAPMSMPPPSHQVVKFNVMNNALTCYDGAKSNSRAHFICGISKKQIIQIVSCYFRNHSKSRHVHFNCRIQSWCLKVMILISKRAFLILYSHIWLTLFRQFPLWWFVDRRNIWRIFWHFYASGNCNIILRAIAIC